MAHIEFDSSLLQTLRNKVVVLTRGASGIGRATVELFHKCGAKVAFGDVADKLGLQLEAEMNSPNITFQHCDTTSYSDQLALFSKARDLYGCVAIVVANAGISIPQDPFALEADFTVEPSTREIDVNLKGCLYTARIGMAYLRHNGGGDLILTSSIAGFKESTGLTPYLASKHGVIGIMRGLRLSAIEEGIRVNVICPWMTKTALVKGIEKGWETLNLPTNTPEDVARSILICSTASRGKDGTTYKGARLPFSGKIVYVAGGESYEIEDALQELEPQWLGIENSRILKTGQDYLMNPATSWDASKMS